MIIFIETANQKYKIDAGNPLNIAIPLKFNGAQPAVYGVEKGSSKPCEAGEMVGDTRRGGSVNFEQYKFIPHCNGTHTECVGHITRKRISVNDCLRDAFISASLISIKPEKATATNENYPNKLSENDLLITRTAIEKALENFKLQISDFRSKENPKSEIRNPKSLIIRTLPNDQGKLSRTYLEEIPPFFSTEAMRFLAELEINHLLVDLPSIDRLFDDGKLSNHRIFWNVRHGAFEISAESFVNNTITELIYVPDEIKDGEYLLNLQIAAFEADASPSRPVLFKIL